MFFHIFEWQGKKSDDRKKKIEVRNSIKIILYDFLSVLLVNGERIAEPDKFTDGNIILNKTEVFNVFIFEGNKGSMVGCDFTVIG